MFVSANFRAISLVVLSSVISFSCQAEPVITAVVQDFEKYKPVDYLSKGTNDDLGYMAVSARIDLPAGVTCVTPTRTSSSKLANYFIKNSLEINMVGEVQGFSHLENQQTPLASYSYNDNEKKYCAAPGGKTTILLPNHRFGLKGQVGYPEPKFVLSLLYTAKGQEQLSSLLTAWANAAATVATGGAATTVAGLSKLAGGKAISTISSTFNDLKSNRTEQRFSVDLPWGELRKGPTERRITFYKAELGNFEAVEDGVKRIRANPANTSVQKLMEVVLTFEYRRSLFVNDSDLSGSAFLPQKTGKITGINVLNYPAAEDDIHPNIYRVLSARSPAISQGIAAGDATKCNAAFGILRDMGLNELDRGLVINALIDSSQQDLKQNSGFLDKCFSYELPTFATLKSIFGTEYGKDGINNVALVPTGIASKNSPIDSNYEQRLSEIASFLAIGDKKRKELSFSSATLTNAPIGISGEFPLSYDNIAQQSQAFASIDIERVSCMYRLIADPGVSDNYRAFMLATIKNSTDGKVEPYLIVLDLNSRAPHELRSMQIRSVFRDLIGQSHYAYLRSPGISYPANSTCKPLVI